MNADRLLARLEDLARLTDPDSPFTRRAFTDRYLEGRALLRQWFEEAGLRVHVDAGGNLVGRREGREKKVLMIGSHVDTVVGGGKYDGVLGVLAALEVAHALPELRHTLEVVDFLSEEPSDYGASCVGSRALAGTLTAQMLSGTNEAGETLRDAMLRMGARPDELDGSKVRNDIAAYFELHIEQGPVLEREEFDLGLVSGIVAIERRDLVFEGRPDHAGTTPMNLRKDALVAAAWSVTLLNQRAAEANEDAPLVATVGQLRVWPNNSNVVPSRAELGFEARALDPERLRRFVEAYLDEVDAVAFAEDVVVSSRPAGSADPLTCDPGLMNDLRGAAAELGLSFKELPSGAGHDAMQIGNIAPAAMLFVPSRGGRSHTPDEFTEAAQIVAGARTLVEAVRRADRRLASVIDSA